jgi:Flp pilus assembly protein TadG
MTRMRRQQRGIVAVLVAIALLVLLAMAGLAIDTGHLVLNKSRLQSTVDAAALAAAKVLDQTGSEAQATDAANSVFAVNANRLKGATNAGIGVQYSSTLYPFAPGSTPANYVRVRADNLSWRAGFIRVLGLDTLSTGATAVAGPSAPIEAPCDLFPVAVCAVTGSVGPYWGNVPYPKPGNTVTLLKLASPKAGDTFGPGNFQLIRLGGPGGNIIRDNMAGGGGCVEPGGAMVEVDPKPGNTVGPVTAGMNTRFGLYEGTQGTYPPDLIVRPSPATPLEVESKKDGERITFNGTPITDIGDVAYSYSHYLADYRAENYTHEDAGRARRRVITIPIVDCSNPVSGSSGTLPVKGFGSFFLLQPAVQKGTENWIFGQFLGEGTASGTPGPHGGYGVYKIVLHNDPDSDDS